MAGFLSHSDHHGICLIPAVWQALPYRHPVSCGGAPVADMITSTFGDCSYELHCQWAPVTATTLIPTLLSLTLVDIVLLGIPLLHLGGPHCRCPTPSDTLSPVYLPADYPTLQRPCYLPLWPHLPTTTCLSLGQDISLLPGTLPRIPPPIPISTGLQELTWTYRYIPPHYDLHCHTPPTTQTSRHSHTLRLLVDTAPHTTVYSPPTLNLHICIQFSQDWDCGGWLMDWNTLRLLLPT